MATRIHAKTEEERKARKRERARLRQQKCRKRKKEAALRKQRELSLSQSSLDQIASATVIASTTNGSSEEVSPQVLQKDTTLNAMPPLIDPGVCSYGDTSSVLSSSPVILKNRSSSFVNYPSDSSHTTSCSALPSSPTKQGLNRSHHSSSSLSINLTETVVSKLSTTTLEQRQHCSSSPDTIARFPLSTENSPQQLSSRSQPKILSTVVSFGLPQPIYISSPERDNRKNKASSHTASANEEDNSEVEAKLHHLSFRAPDKPLDSKLFYPEELATPKPNPEDDLESVANAMLSLGRNETLTPKSTSYLKEGGESLSQSSSRQISKGALPLMPEDSFFAKLQQQQHEQQQQKMQHRHLHQQQFINGQHHQHSHPPSIYAPFNFSQSQGLVSMAHRMKHSHAGTSSRHGILPPSSTSGSIHPQPRPGSFLTYRF